MSQWFHFHFLQFLRKQNSKRVALILDNAPSHAINLVDAEGQVKIFNLPEKTTSIYQPMGAGIIAALKTRYKYDLLVGILARLDEAPLAREATKDWKKGTRGLQEGMKPNILDAIIGADVAWGYISPRTIQRCWAHTGILPPEQTNAIRVKAAEEGKQRAGRRSRPRS